MVDLKARGEFDSTRQCIDVTFEVVDDGRGTLILATIEMIEEMLGAAQKGYPTVDGKRIEFTYLEGMELLDTITLGNIVLKHTERSIEAQRQGRHIQQAGYGDVFEFEVGVG